MGAEDDSEEIKRAPSGALFRVHVLEEGLCALNVSSLRTFLALLDIELHFLTFSQRFEAFTSDSTEVYEYVCTAVVLSDETEAFLVVKPLNSTVALDIGCLLKI